MISLGVQNAAKKAINSVLFQRLKDQIGESPQQAIISEERLQESLAAVIEILDALEKNRIYTNLQPFCEPQLGRRGLYRDTGGTGIADRETAMLWLLNQADGQTSLLDIAEKSKVELKTLVAVATELLDAGLFEEYTEGQGVTE